MRRPKPDDVDGNRANEDHLQPVAHDRITDDPQKAPGPDHHEHEKGLIQDKPDQARRGQRLDDV